MTQLQEQFADFLETRYGHEVKEFGEQYPEERYLHVSWHDLREFDQLLAERVIENPRNCLGELEEALRFHTQHEEAYLPNARAVFCDGPQAKHVHELRAEDIGRFNTVIGRLTGVGGQRTDLEVAVFTCRDCDAKNEVRQKRDTLMKPVECRSCGRRQVDYLLDHGESKYVVNQSGKLEDLSHLTGGRYPESIGITLTAQAAETVGEGDWIKVSGIISADLHEETTIADIRMEGWTATSLPRQQVAEKAEQLELFTTPSIDLTEKHLVVFAEHVDLIFEDFEKRRELNEEEVKLKIVTPLIELLGWDIHSNEVRMEHTNSQGNQLDYALFAEERPLVCIEAKQPDNLQNSAREQILSYMVQGRIKWGLLTDGIEYKLLRYDIETGRTVSVFSSEYQVLSEYLPEISNVCRQTFELENKGDKDGAV